MRGSCVAVCLLASGCSSLLGIDDFKLNDAGAPGDTGVDTISVDAPPGCLGSGSFVICPPVQPTANLVFDAATGRVDTDTSSHCLPGQPPAWIQAGQPPSCIVVARTITVTAPILVTGSRPLVLAAIEEVRIDQQGQLDAAAHRGSTLKPPAAPAAVCGMPIPADNSAQGAGGGAGGSFVGDGARGGDGGGGQAQGGMPKGAEPPPTHLRAGCDGGDGGSGQGGQPPPSAGRGGGAVFVVAGMRIIVDGAINASGSGGDPGNLRGGGGGGGAGGMIVLHAPAIAGNGTVLANGGAGAGGSSGTNVGMGGEDPSPNDPTLPARGGMFGGGGGQGRGGDGFAGTSPPTPGLGNGADRGGGGGGGGAGFVRTNIAPTGLAISPAPTVVP